MYDYFMEKLVYQMFILGTGNLDEALRRGLGGVIFFTRDIKSKEQFKNLISEIKSKSLIPPFLSIDQEGGRVERTENIHPRYLSAKYAFEKGEEFLKTQTENIAKELKEYGINLNFAPCADVNTNPDNPIIGERAFSSKVDEVIRGVEICSQIYKKNGIIPCIKHFPGHGDASKDSHLTLPEINLTLKEMEEIHIKPFKCAVESGIDMIMAAHLHCGCFDNTPVPASLSRNVIGYLRNKLNFRGVVITDDMVMKGVQDYGSGEACIMALEAGADMFIFRDSDKNASDTINFLAREVKKSGYLQKRVIEANKRISKLKERLL